jgi:hypothetical protein
MTKLGRSVPNAKRVSGEYFKWGENFKFAIFTPFEICTPFTGRALVRHQIWSRDSSSNFLAADAEDTTRSEAPLPTNSSSDRAQRMYFLFEE